MGLCQQEYWDTGLPFPSLGDLTDLGIEPASPAWQADSYLWATWECPLLLLFSCWVMSDSLWPHGLCARLLCPPLSPEVSSDSCPLRQWCYLNTSSFLLLPSIFPSIMIFSNKSALCIRWPRYWNFSFSISPFNEYSGLISFRIDWFHLLASRGLSRVFSSTTDQKHQFFGAQPSLRSESHIVHDY